LPLEIYKVQANRENAKNVKISTLSLKQSVDCVLSDDRL